LGQNMVGFARLAVSGPAGTTVTLRFAEVLIPDGTIYTTSLRSARCTDQYTLSGNGPETYEPRFTFHGFRYVEITGFPGKPSLDAITGVVLHSDYRSTGAFACSNAMLNQLQGNIVWGQKGNFLDVPTDCPQRDERLGWTGDIQVFCRTACFNGDVAGFLTKWLVDLTDAQSPKGAFPMVAPNLLRHAFPEHSDGGPAWADAGVICPWTLYLCYGDTRVLERNYDAMLRYMAYLDKTDYRTRHCFGDWLNIDDPTPKDLIGPAFHAYDAQLMAKIAHVLGHRRDAAKFAARAKRLRAEFNEEFVTPTGRLAGGSQTAHVLALHFDLLPPPRRTQAAERLVQRVNEFKDHLSTGFVGTPYLLHVLTRFGHLDLAYKLLLNEDFPSWGYPIKHGNATTMWERWDGWRHDKGFQDPAMNSFNHYAYGAVGDWIYQNILGIELDESRPGYEHFFVRPVPGGGLTWARGEYQSVRGMIGSEWKIEDGRFLLQVTVPGQTQATIALPGRRGKSVRVGPGTHRLETKWDTAARPVTRTARPVSV
ncbi:MAG: family 78 glycoside hydrolase catalytic domain, partial [Tepidisphaeraceae bacterium]